MGLKPHRLYAAASFNLLLSEISALRNTPTSSDHMPSERSLNVIGKSNDKVFHFLPYIIKSPEVESGARASEHDSLTPSLPPYVYMQCIQHIEDIRFR